MNTQPIRWVIAIAGLVLLGFVAATIWKQVVTTSEIEGVASGNGRIEATEIDVATKIAGRVEEILVREGDSVKAGQLVAVMDSERLEAELREAEANLQQAVSNVATARSQLSQRRSERAAAIALVQQRHAELEVAIKSLDRSSRLASQGAVSKQKEDDDRARYQSAKASASAARAQVEAADAAIVTASEQIKGQESAVNAAQATIERIRADIEDNSLMAPRDGRVQYIVAQIGEVVQAGGRVINLIDLSDVYMTFFLPTAAAGRVSMGTEVRIVLDAAPDQVIPARVTYVSDVAQFTPKTVETESEREKLMFRIRAQIPPELVNKYLSQAKIGVPGVAYVRLDPEAEWPAHLQKNILK